MLDSQTTTMKQNVRFQEGPCHEKNPDGIKNGWLSAIIGTNMHNIWQTMVVCYTITTITKQIVVILDWRFASTTKVVFLVELVCCLLDFPSDYLKSKNKITWGVCQAKEQPVSF